MPQIDFTQTGVSYLAQMWAARQIAIAGIIGFSLFKKSVPMLQLSLIAYSVMNVQDALIGVAHQDMGLIIGASFFGTLAATMAFKLGRLTRTA
jgi:hypothetical protein